MGFNLHLRKISSKRRSNSKTEKENTSLPQSNPFPRGPDKLKLKSSIDPQFSDSSHKSMHVAAKKLQNRDKSGKGSSTTQSDELVKYMSNLPGYLQRAAADKGENIQEKALNFGVLDWSRLEKWKSKQTHVPALNSSFASLLTSEASSSSAATESSSTSGGSKKGLISSAKPSSREFETFGEILSQKSFQKQKRNEYDKQTSLAGSVASMSKHHGISLVPNENAINGRDIEAKKRLEDLKQHNLKKKERYHKPSSPRRVTSLKSKHKGVSLSSPKKSSSISSEVKTMKDILQNSEVDVDHKQFHSKPSNIVLLRPHRVRKSSPEGYFELPQLRTSCGEDVSESSQSSSFTFLPEEVYSEDVCSEIPHSSTLTSVTNPSETLQHRFNYDVDIDPACSDKICSLHSEDNSIEEGVVENKPRNQCAFGLNQIRRSFSWRERSTGPQLNAMHIGAKSGPLAFESSACFDHSSREKPKGHKRTRSTPFLRLLDPILKHKAANHWDESSFTEKGSVDSISFANAEKSKGSSAQAILQLTVKNGLPLFKFVLNSERKVLAATMKSFLPMEKDDSGCCFSFYLVNEIKKKSGGWMSHVSKEKSGGYVYNMVGQMKFSSRKINDTNYQNNKRQGMMKEYVLLSVEIDQTDRGPSRVNNRRELAAVVIEVPRENTSHEGLNNSNEKGCLKCFLADERCFCFSEETHVCSNTTAILPGGVHSSPKKGEPSPLIHRWKSGGTCDCGGWDVGCKLLVLSNQKPGSNVQTSSKSHLERFQLFVQEGAEQNSPLFTLVPLKDGLYSVEFSSTIDHLQAFFISVAVLSSQKLPSPMEMINKQLSSKDKNEIQGKAAPINYNPIPPLSPVGRV